MPESVEQDRIAKQRIHQVFTYLKELNAHRNPAIRQVREQPWSMWLDELPTHPSIEFRQRINHAASQDTTPESVVTEDDAVSPDFLLRVRRPQLTSPPEPPEQIQDWLLRGWDDPHKPAEHLTSRNEIGADGETITVHFDDDPSRVTLLERWSTLRDSWQVAELPARAANDLFGKFYVLHSQIERDSEKFDLVIGDGILSWHQPEGGIYHPLLSQRVQLVFDAQIPEFQIVDADFSAELYTSLFQTNPDVDPRLLKTRSNEFKEKGYHPLDEEVSGLLKGLVNQLSQSSSQGRYIGNQRPEPAAAEPVIGRVPVLFLRLRTKGMGTAIQSVLESMEEREEFCDALRTIVGCDAVSVSDVDTDHEPKSRDAIRNARDVLFGKSANLEQLRIARAVDHHGAVLVQGPPGTGKSHTIANLIGHLLAHGQSVLVTSHTTKALKVLRGHIVEELRPLCVSLLESDLDSRSQLEESVQAISARLGEADIEALEREADELEWERSHLIEQIESRQEELRKAVTDEYREIVFGGSGIAPSQAARIVAKGTSQHDWIPAPVALGAPCPFSAEEVRELYATNTLTNAEDDELLDQSIPDCSSLPAPDDLKSALEKLLWLTESGQIERRYWASVEFGDNIIAVLKSLVDQLRDVATEFAKFDDWKLAAVEAGRQASLDHCPWRRLLAKVEETISLVQQTHTESILLQPQVGNTLGDIQQLELVREIRSHLAEGGRLNLWTLTWNMRWKNALTEWTVQGRAPASDEEFVAVENCLNIRIARTELQRLWDGVVAANGGPSFSELGTHPEQGASQFTTGIQEAINWWPGRWTPIERQLDDVGFQWKAFLGEQPQEMEMFGTLRRAIKTAAGPLRANLKATKDHLESLRLKRKLKAVVSNLDSFDVPVVVNLREAVQNSDAVAYSDAYDRCLAFAERRKHAIRRRELLSRLRQPAEPVALSWADAVSHRQSPHDTADVPGDVLRAWEWRQLHDELERRAEVDIDMVTQELERLQSDLHRTTNQLIDRKAWASQVRRTTRSRRQSLMGWLDIMNRIGRGYGRRVPKLRTEAQQKMEECRSAVPVWIMPLSRVVENFDFSASQFDVVVIDEASQCDVLALLALAITKKVIVVGDDKQVSPSAVGMRLDGIDNLIRLHLDGIPNAVLYDGKMSIYQLAKQSFPGLICLQEHFRCVPDIIEFSNHLSYQGEIKPLREQGSSTLLPHVVPYRVEGIRQRRSKTNHEEAISIVSLIAAACEHDAYADETFEVISLLGDDQAKKIESLLHQHLSPEECERRRITCGNAAQFQGDERDVIFLSMVYSPQDGPLAMNLEQPLHHQRYNVAASRARNQMWVVYSLNPEIDLQANDIRRRLIEHALDPTALNLATQQAADQTESEFERQVCAELVQRGFRVHPQWPVGCYRIDLVVEGSNRRVAIECDGDRWHPLEKIPDDMARQAVLERLGWKFIRIRGSVYFRDSQATLESVVAKLHDLGIEPLGPTASSEMSDFPDGGNDSVTQQIIRRAAELRHEWANPEDHAESQLDDSENEYDSPQRVEDATLCEEFDPEDDAPEEVASVDNSPDDVALNDVANVDPPPADVPQPSVSSELPPDTTQLDNTQLPDLSQDGETSTATIHSGQLRLDLFSDNHNEQTAQGIQNPTEQPSPPELTTPDLPLNQTLADRILTLLQQTPGLKAREISRELGLDRSEVNSVLYGRLGAKVRVDDEYRWSPR